MPKKQSPHPVALHRRIDDEGGQVPGLAPARRREDRGLDLVHHPEEGVDAIVGGLRAGEGEDFLKDGEVDLDEGVYP